MNDTNLNKKQWVSVIAVVLIVGLVAGFVGNFVSSSITGNTIKNYANAVGLYPYGNKYLDSWFPYTNGNVYITADGTENGSIIFRKIIIIIYLIKN